MPAIARHPQDLRIIGNTETDRRFSVRAEQLREIVRQASALRLVEAKRRLGSGWSATYRAIAELEQASVVKTDRRGKVVLILSSEEGAQEVDASARRSATLRSGKARAIFDYVRSAPGAGIQEIIRALEMQPRIVYYHVRHQVDAGVLVSSRAGRYSSLRVMEQGVSVEASRGESPLKSETLRGEIA